MRALEPCAKFTLQRKEEKEVSRIPRMLDMSRYEVYWSTTNADSEDMVKKINQISSLGMVVRQNKMEHSGIFAIFHYNSGELRAIKNKMKELSPHFLEFGGELDLYQTWPGKHGPEICFQIVVKNIPNPTEVVTILDRFCEILGVRPYDGFRTISHEYNVRITEGDRKRWIPEGGHILDEARGKGGKAV